MITTRDAKRLYTYALTLVEFAAMTDAIRYACNLGRPRLRSIRQPKTTGHEQEQETARKSILEAIRFCLEDPSTVEHNALNACRLYLEAEDILEERRR